MEKGMKPWEATKLGVGEVAWPIITSTATTLAAFIPLALWPGLMGQFMKYLPIGVIITLASSLFVALVINPVLISTFMRIDKGEKANYTKIWRMVLISIVIGILFLVMGATALGNIAILFGFACIVECICPDSCQQGLSKNFFALVGRPLFAYAGICPERLQAMDIFLGYRVIDVHIAGAEYGKTSESPVFSRKHA